MRLILRRPEEVLTSGFSVFEIDQIFLRARVELEVRADDGVEIQSALRYEVGGGWLASRVKHRRATFATNRRKDQVRARWESGSEVAEREWMSPYWAPTEIWRALELNWPMDDATCVWPIQYSVHANSPESPGNPEKLETQILAVRRESDSRGRLGWAKHSQTGVEGPSENVRYAEFNEDEIRAKLSSIAMPLGIGFEPGKLKEISAGFLGLPALKLQRVTVR
jgi:hypothetical protein